MKPAEIFFREKASGKMETYLTQNDLKLIAEIMDQYADHKNAPRMKKVLFLNDKNGYEAADPIAHLVEIDHRIPASTLRVWENNQPGAGRTGGNWERIMKDGDFKYNLLSQGKKSDYQEGDYDEIYKLISGNY